MEDFPANSAKARTRSEEPSTEKIERVTTAEAVRRKPGLGRQFKETFIGGSARSAIEYMTMEVVIPTVRDMMAEALQSGIERLIYGDTRPRRGGAVPPSYSNVGHVNYQRMSSGAPTRPPSNPSRMLSRRSRARQDFDEIVIPTRTEAEEVLDRMYDILSRHGVVLVSELYELTGISSNHVDHKWGWTRLQGAKVARLRSGGFLLDLPTPESLER